MTVAEASVSRIGEQFAGGVSVRQGQRVLIRAGIHAGIWICQNGPWQRAEDANDELKLRKGARVSVTNGTFVGQIWQLVTPDGFVLDVNESGWANALATNIGDLGSTDVNYIARRDEIYSRGETTVIGPTGIAQVSSIPGQCWGLVEARVVTNNGNVYHINGTFTKVGSDESGTVTLVTQSAIYSSETEAAMACVLQANVAGIRLSATGLASNVKWEVFYTFTYARRP